MIIKRPKIATGLSSSAYSNSAHSFQSVRLSTSNEEKKIGGEKCKRGHRDRV